MCNSFLSLNDGDFCHETHTNDLSGEIDNNDNC